MPELSDCKIGPNLATQLIISVYVGLDTKFQANSSVEGFSAIWEI